MMKILGITFVAIIALVILFFLFTQGPRLLFSNFPEFGGGIEQVNNSESENKGADEKGAPADQALLGSGLRTNTLESSIPLNTILNGGPGKDGIPSIDAPNFRDVNSALATEDGNGFGVAVSLNGVNKFYPYNIMVWHEIVNDSFDEVPALVTFCPLCGSAIVFNPVIQNVKREFGVSGLLWESNLLMYDRTNESLWSQTKGEAVVGVDTGTKLALYDSEVMTLQQFASQFPSGEVLARPLDSVRDYDFYPYGDYDQSESLIFETSVQDTRLPAKTLMYVITSDETSVALKRDDVLATQNVELEVNGNQLLVTGSNGNISVIDSNGNELPGYTEMWFSWATHHQDNGVVWTR